MAKRRDYDEKHRAFNKKILNKIARDPKFRNALIKDAQLALASAGLDRELKELEILGLERGIVMKECAPLSCTRTCLATCKSNTCLNTTSC
jgi:hypothetical protein